MRFQQCQMRGDTPSFFSGRISTRCLGEVIGDGCEDGQMNRPPGAEQESEAFSYKGHS